MSDYHHFGFGSPHGRRSLGLPHGETQRTFFPCGWAYLPSHCSIDPSAIGDLLSDSGDAAVGRGDVICAPAGLFRVVPQPSHQREERRLVEYRRPSGTPSITAYPACLLDKPNGAAAVTNTARRPPFLPHPSLRLHPIVS